MSLQKLQLVYLTLCLQKLFSSPEMSRVLAQFCVYHINAPGQEPGADSMGEDQVFPDMEQLSQSVEFICHHFG